MNATYITIDKQNRQMSYYKIIFKSQLINLIKY